MFCVLIIKFFLCYDENFHDQNSPQNQTEIHKKHHCAVIVLEVCFRNNNNSGGFLPSNRIKSDQISESLPLFAMSVMGGGTLGTVCLIEDEVRYPATPGAAVRAGLFGRSGKKRSCFCCSYCCHTGLAFGIE